MEHVVGCDISKDWFDVGDRRFAGLARASDRHKAKAINRFARELAAGSLVGMRRPGNCTSCWPRRWSSTVITVFRDQPALDTPLCQGPRDPRQDRSVRCGRDRSFCSGRELESASLQTAWPQQRELRKLRCAAQVGRASQTPRARAWAQGSRLVNHFSVTIKAIERRIAEIIIEQSPIGKMPAGSQRAGVGAIVAAHLVEC